jgi:hypothetical protein
MIYIIYSQSAINARWEAIEFFISHCGGWVTSIAKAWPTRFECRPDSELPKLLRAKG